MGKIYIETIERGATATMQIENKYIQSENFQYQDQVNVKYTNRSILHLLKRHPNSPEQKEFLKSKNLDSLNRKGRK